MEEIAQKDVLCLMIKSSAEGHAEGEEWTFGKIIQDSIIKIKNASHVNNSVRRFGSEIRIKSGDNHDCGLHESQIYQLLENYPHFSLSLFQLVTSLASRNQTQLMYISMVTYFYSWSISTHWRLNTTLRSLDPFPGKNTWHKYLWLITEGTNQTLTAGLPTC